MTKSSNDQNPLLQQQQQIQNNDNSRSLLFLRFLAFSLAFSLAETAVVACLSVATSVLDVYGSLSVGVLYATFAMGTLLAGSFVRYFSQNLRPLLVGSIAGMGLFNVACWVIALKASQTAAGAEVEEEDAAAAAALVHRIIIPVSQTEGMLLLVVAVISGLADGLIWPAVGAYITMSAQNLSIERDDDDNDEEVTATYGSYTIPSQKTSWIDTILPHDFHVLAGTLTGWFNVIFLSSLVLGHVYTYYAFRVESFSGMLQAYTQIFVMTLVGIVIMFIAMAPGELVEYEEPCHCQNCPGTCHPRSTGTTCPDAVSKTVSNPIQLAIGLTATEPALYHLVPSHVTYGLIDGLVLGFVARHLVPNVASVGVLATIKSGTAILATPLITQWGNRGNNEERINLVWYGNFLYLLCVSLVGLNLYWYHHHQHHNYNTYTNNSSSEAEAEAEESSSSWFLWTNLIGIYILDGLGFATWQNNTSGALLSEIAPTLAKDTASKNRETELTAAVFAGCKATSGFATALAFFVSPLLPGYAVVGLGMSVALWALVVLQHAQTTHIFLCSACRGWSIGHFRKRE